MYLEPDIEALNLGALVHCICQLLILSIQFWPTQQHPARSGLLDPSDALATKFCLYVKVERA